MKKRVIFYFDGFNFYNGLKDKTLIEPQWKKYYWLDFVKFCNHFLDDKVHTLVSIKYFTAPPVDAGKKSRQSALFSANKILNKDKFIVINGNYQDKEIQCRATCKKVFKTLEEKRTDVAIATSMLLDCFNDKVDTLF